MDRIVSFVHIDGSVAGDMNISNWSLHSIQSTFGTLFFEWSLHGFEQCEIAFWNIFRARKMQKRSQWN